MVWPVYKDTMAGTKCYQEELSWCRGQVLEEVSQVSDPHQVRWQALQEPRKYLPLKEAGTGD